MMNFITELGKCLLFILAVPVIILLSIPLGIYAFVNYVIGVVNTFQGKKPSIVTEFDQKPSDLPRNLTIQPIVGPNPYSDFMERPSDPSITNSNNVTNSNNTMNNSNNTTNYIFNNVPNPFDKNQNANPGESKDRESLGTFIPASKEEPKVVDIKPEEIPLTDYRSLVDDSKKLSEGKYGSLPSSKEDER